MSYAFAKSLAPVVTTCGYGTPLAATNARTTSADSVGSTPRHATPRDASPFASAIRSGVSSRHGGHHEPHTLITSVLPRKSASRTALPPVVVSVKGGAGRPTTGPGSCAAAPSGQTPAPSAQASSHGESRFIASPRDARPGIRVAILLQKPKRFGIVAMPTVLRLGSMRFQIYTRNEHEPPHVHVHLPDGEVVVILEEAVQAVILRDAARNVRTVDVARILAIAEDHFETLIAVWSYYNR